jgi:RNA-directed DNA polymerase
MVLDGMEQAIKASLPRRRCRVNFVRYADDFIVTAKSKLILERYVKPAIERFLAERGLQLSPEKTVITHIQDGFTFLGQTFRKTGNVLHITPAQEGVLALQRKVGKLIRKHVSAPMPILIKKLNETLRGWGNYHRHVVASEAFSRIDNHVYEQLWRMLHRRHPRKSKGWLVEKYWNATGKAWVFSVLEKAKKKGCRLYRVLRLCSLGIRRYVKIQANANPYLPEYGAYFHRRRHHKASRLLPARSMREFQAKIAKGEVSRLGCPTTASFANA